MIPLPSRQRLIRRREKLYERLHAISQHASVHQIEDIMRGVHIINLKLRNYFQREQRDPQEIFND